MSDITPYQQIQFTNVPDPSSGDLSPALDSDTGENFQFLLQSVLMGGMGSTGWGESSSLSSLFMPDLMSLLFSTMLSGSGQQVPSEWTNFPDLSQTEYGYSVNNLYGNYAGTGQPQNVPRGRPVDGPISQGAHSGHMAFDYSVVVGTPIQSTLDGQVKTVGYDPDGYGNYVVIENGPYQVYFAHLSSTPLQVGDRIRAGQILGLSGNTGNSTGPHLHYEIRRNGQTVDPHSFLAV